MAYLTQLVPEYMSAESTCHMALPPSAPSRNPELLSAGVLNKSVLGSLRNVHNFCPLSHNATAGSKNITPVTFPNSMRPGLQGPEEVLGHVIHSCRLE